MGRFEYSELEQLQDFNDKGSIWVGDLISKASARTLEERGLIRRVATFEGRGLRVLTDQGKSVARKTRLFFWIWTLGRRIRHCLRRAWHNPWPAQVGSL